MAYGFDAIHDGIVSEGKITDASNNTAIGGMARSRFNMLADPPVAFDSTTVKNTISYFPACAEFFGFSSEVADADRAPSWNYLQANRDARHFTNTATSPTHIQQPYSREELISHFAHQVQMAAGSANLRLDLDYYKKQLNGPNGATVFDDGDIINLDFRGMTLGEALDTFAQRLGCVWLYDRAAPSLILSLARKSTTGQGDRVTNGCIPDLHEWLTNMEKYRVSGYINTMTVDLPQTVLLTHEAHYCSRFGPERSMDFGVNWVGVYGPSPDNFGHTFLHLVDSRSHITQDGVLSTRFTTGLSEDAAAMWHSTRSSAFHVVVELRDHIPAMVGHNSQAGWIPVWLPGTNHYPAVGGSFHFLPEYFFASGGSTKGIGNTNLKLDTWLGEGTEDEQVPWNYSSGLLRTACRNINLADIESHPTQADEVFDLASAQKFDTTLKRRREILETRVNELRYVADGDMTFCRMPLGIMQGVLRQITPSVGLQYERVQFGSPDISNVRYRIWGDNTHPILYPSGSKIQTSTGSNRVSTVFQSGTRHTVVRNSHRGNIVRMFMARIIGRDSTVVVDPNAGTAEYSPFRISKYFFVEASPDGNPFTMYWSSSDALGYKGLCSGIAFNLYEQWFQPSSLYPNFPPPASVGGTVFRQDFGPNEDEEIVIPEVPILNIVPVYEVANRLGFTSYWIAVQPDLKRICPPAPPGGFAAVTPEVWPYMGASGAAISNRSDLADIIESA